MRLVTLTCAVACAAGAPRAEGQDCRPEPGVPHVTGIDSDGDGIPDSRDNCPACFNPGQPNSAGGLLGDACRPLSPEPPAQPPRTHWNEFKPKNPFSPRIFVRPYALGAWGRHGARHASAGASLQLAGNIDGWKPDPRYPHFQLPPYWRYHAGLYADLRVTSPQGGLDVGVDHRPLWWGWYASHLPEVAIGLQLHVIRFDEAVRGARSPLALGGVPN